jgi:hypothetical protein
MEKRVSTIVETTASEWAKYLQVASAATDAGNQFSL